ncbi:hypothetical protein [Phreatobacter aquaticus]|nr:hypothetical protein [Phreatobacter aquaticus]
MIRDEQDLPTLTAPPLSPEASFDAEVAETFSVTWLEPVAPARS